MKVRVAMEARQASPRLWAIALNTWREATRQRLFGAFAVEAAAAEVVLSRIRDFERDLAVPAGQIYRSTSG